MTVMSQLPESRGTAIGFGVLVALAGVVLLVWPGATTLVLVTWLGLAILAYGIYELVTAFTGAGDRSRLWSGVIGVIAIIGGLAVFLTPLVSTVTVGLVIGWYWLIGGIFGIVGAIVEPGNRVIRLLVALLSVVAGIVVIAQPGLALVTLVWFSGLWMLVAGLVMIAAALFGRRSVAAT